MFNKYSVLLNLVHNYSLPVKYFSITPFINRKDAQMLSKLLQGKRKDKKRWYTDNEQPKLMQIKNIPNTISQGGKNASRRIAVLNKLFIKHITDRMATGEASEEILGHGLEISTVKVTNDFQNVNVYWMAKGDAEDETVEKILRKAAGGIRHELSQLRLMGEIPKINFVKDKQYAKKNEVNRLLEKADFGEDYVPVGLGEKLKNELSRNPDDLTTSQNDGDNIPQFERNVMGLDHEKIMKKIEANVGKTKRAWEHYSNTDHQRDVKVKLSDVQDKIQATELTKYLDKRQVQKKISKRKQDSIDEQIDL